MQQREVRRDWIDTGSLRRDLGKFFSESRKELGIFGSTVNQTFEAFVYASVIGWYRERGWAVWFVHPPNATAGAARVLRLKFSTRGRPGNYTYAKCALGDEVLQVRHQLRVATRAYSIKSKYRANIVLDVAVLKDVDLSEHSTNDFLDNADLLTFGEAKHMSAFAELIASFVGVVYEMQPERLRRRRFKSKHARSRPAYPGHPSAFLFVSGFLFHTAQGLAETIRNRGFDIDIFSRSNQLTSAIQVASVRSSPSS
jgi:hypothetical protein